MRPFWPPWYEIIRSDSLFGQQRHMPGIAWQVRDEVEKIILFAYFSLDCENLWPTLLSECSHLYTIPFGSYRLPMEGEARAACSHLVTGYMAEEGPLPPIRATAAFVINSNNIPRSLAACVCSLIWKSYRINEPQPCHSTYTKGPLYTIDRNRSHKPKH